MNSQTCVHFKTLPPSKRLTFTLTLLVLGLGYLFAMIHVFSSHAGRDGDPSLSAQDLKIAYSGSPGDTRLEASLKGPMQAMITEGPRNEIIAWVRAGGEKPPLSKKSSPSCNKTVWPVITAPTLTYRS